VVNQSKKMLQTQYYYNLIDAIVYLIAAIIPAYFILKSRKSINNNNNYFRKLTMVLVGFILVQVIYHIAAIIGFRLLAKGFLEPLSMAALLFFGIMYIMSTWKTRKQQQQEELKT
jgi:lipopolysaccharide export LptBFGC system permease protein LptF